MGPSTASYYSQVSELAEELLITHSYFESNPNYWVDSSLVSDSDAKTHVFKATEATCNLQEDLSPQNTASKLFHAHFAVMPQANFLQKITFDTHYTNGFSIRICSRTLSMSSECNTI